MRQSRVEDEAGEKRGRQDEGIRRARVRPKTDFFCPQSPTIFFFCVIAGCSVNFYPFSFSPHFSALGSVQYE